MEDALDIKLIHSLQQTDEFLKNKNYPGMLQIRILGSTTVKCGPALGRQGDAESQQARIEPADSSD